MRWHFKHKTCCRSAPFNLLPLCQAFSDTQPGGWTRTVATTQRINWSLSYTVMMIAEEVFGRKTIEKTGFPFEYVLAQGPPLDFGVDLKTLSSSEKRNPPQRPKSNRHVSVENCFAAVLVQVFFPVEGIVAQPALSKKN